MKIVIDIDEDYYRIIKYDVNNGMDYKPCVLIANGTPLDNKINKIKKDIDAQFLCKDCERYNLCNYYYKRKSESYICKYFHLTIKNNKVV